MTSAKSGTRRFNATVANSPRAQNMASERNSGLLSAATIRSHEVTVRVSRRSIGLARIRRSLCREVGLIGASIFGCRPPNAMRSGSGGSTLAATPNVAARGGDVCGAGHSKNVCQCRRLRAGKQTNIARECPVRRVADRLGRIDNLPQRFGLANDRPAILQFQNTLTMPVTKTAIDLLAGAAGHFGQLAL